MEKEVLKGEIIPSDRELTDTRQYILESFQKFDKGFQNKERVVLGLLFVAIIGAIAPDADSEVLSHIKEVARDVGLGGLILMFLSSIPSQIHKKSFLDKVEQFNNDSVSAIYANNAKKVN